jgi:C4-dicarboxylate-specific signal transduction histidine kinase
MAEKTPLRRQLLFAFGILFGGGIFVASVGLALALPSLDTPREVALYLAVLLAAELVVIFFIGRLTLGRALFEPIDGLVDDVRTMASGGYEHRVRPAPTQEIQAVADSVNAMAERLIQDQHALAENVASLDDTNKALVEARAQVVRAARLASTGTLASGIAHELGNPLGALLAYVDVARSRAEANGEDTELLDSMREEAIRIDRIIRSLLDFARSKEAGPGPLDCWPVVERVRDLLKAQGRLEGVDCRWERKGEVPPVLIDAQRLEQVLVNLLLNALEAIEDQDERMISLTVQEEPGPGALLPRRRKGDPPGVNYAHRRRIAAVETGRPAASLTAADRIVVLSVEDNGPGMAPETLEEVFDPFFTTKEPGKGTGLGLALSAQLVEGVGGEILAGNRNGGGAVFSLRLPGIVDAPGEVALVRTEEPATGGDRS